MILKRASDTGACWGALDVLTTKGCRWAWLGRAVRGAEGCSGWDGAGRGFELGAGGAGGAVLGAGWVGWTVLGRRSSVDGLGLVWAVDAEGLGSFVRVGEGSTWVELEEEGSARCLWPWHLLDGDSTNLGRVTKGGSEVWTGARRGLDVFLASLAAPSWEVMPRPSPLPPGRAHGFVAPRKVLRV